MKRDSANWSESEYGPMASLLARFGLPSVFPNHPSDGGDPGVLAWKRSLPSHLSVRALQRSDPTIVAELALKWNDRTAIDAIFDRLLFRTARQERTFSLEVLNELAALREHARAITRWDRRSIWDDCYASQF